jgi:tRNA-Thr(GGU) m(6)t(6)A37 methyltransferase TsaA
MKFNFDSIGIVHSCYKEKFAIPRQSGLVTASTASIELLEPYNEIEAVKGLEDFSHLWIAFIFHQHLGKGWSPTVRPPRMEGKQRFGVFATRSSYRPNPLGLSLVELERIEQKKAQLLLHIKGADLLDQTPVIDIKPYIPYSDSIPTAKGGFTDWLDNHLLSVRFSAQAKKQCLQASKNYPYIEQFIRQLLSIDHRPHYMKNINKTYSSRVYEFDLQWQVSGNSVEVIELKEQC